ncbi:hypothetical protein [Arthrobacter sp. DR-2P]|nr:hypothetical protein [Arthrobacter sp. DR-2P]
MKPADPAKQANHVKAAWFDLPAVFPVYPFFTCATDEPMNDD